MYMSVSDTRRINKYTSPFSSRRAEITPFETSTAIYVNGRWQEIS